MFPSGYDTLEYSWVKATTVSVRLRILFVTLQNTNMQAMFFQKDHVAWSCPTVDHAPIRFFLADHGQECVHVDRVHGVASYMIGFLDHCIRDNHMPMAMLTLLPNSRQIKDTSNYSFHDVPPLLYAAAFHDHAKTCSTAFETLHVYVVPMNVQHPLLDPFL